MLTSAVGPADVSVDRSTVKVGPRSTAPRVSLALRLTGGPLGSGLEKEKKRGLGLVLGSNQLGRLGWPNKARLGSWFSSACGSAGRLGQVG
jgi:hypothetical protein